MRNASGGFAIPGLRWLGILVIASMLVGCASTGGGYTTRREKTARGAGIGAAAGAVLGAVLGCCSRYRAQLCSALCSLSV